MPNCLAHRPGPDASTRGLESAKTLAANSENARSRPSPWPASFCSSFYAAYIIATYFGSSVMRGTTISVFTLPRLKALRNLL